MRANFYSAFLAVLLACSTPLQAASTIQFTATSYTVAESAGAVTLTAQRFDDTSTVVGADFTTLDGTAISGSKYTSNSGTLTFAAGETNKTIVVPILNESFVEGSKNFRVALSNPTGGAVLGSRTTATVIITDNDVGIEFQFSSCSVAEDAGQVLLGVARRDDGTLPVTVQLASADLSATNGVDYAGTNITLSFVPQERFKWVAIPILNNSLKQPDRAFRVSLSKPSGGTLGITKTATVTIVDNDQGFQFESAAYTLAEDAGAALIRVLRGTDDTNSILTVDRATANGSAINGLDYAGLTNTLTFSPGERVKQIAIPILNNGIKQATRSFRLNLTNPTGGGELGSPPTTTVSILDNDPGVGFELTRYTNAWGHGGVTVTVLRGNDSALGPVRVDYATSDLTAKTGPDYQAVSGTLELKENEMVTNLTIPILRGRPAGGTKSFLVTLSNPTGGATLGTSVTTVNILGAYITLAPPFDTALAIHRDLGLNTLTWAGGGQLQRADRANGPWQTLTNASSPTTVQAPIPATFYRVTSQRPANLYVPSSYDGHTPMPLVILLHGYGDTGASQEAYMQFRPLAETRGFLYCNPDSTVDHAGNEFWNATDACCDFFSTRADDASDLRGLIEEIGRQCAVDHKRVYVIGWSNGGFMAYRMACQSADIIAGIASLAGTTFLISNSCTPSQRVNILHIHGAADVTVPYAGGASQGFAANLPQFPGALQTVWTWAGYNGATGLTTDAAPSLKLTTDLVGLDTVVARFTNSPPGGAIELWTILGANHGPTLSSEFSPRVIDWLLAHPKP